MDERNQIFGMATHDGGQTHSQTEMGGTLHPGREGQCADMLRMCVATSISHIFHYTTNLYPSPHMLELGN